MLQKPVTHKLCHAAHAIYTNHPKVPHLDGRAASKKSLKERGLAGSLKMAAAVIGDTLRGFLGMHAVS